MPVQNRNSQLGVHPRWNMSILHANAHQHTNTFTTRVASLLTGTDQHLQITGESGGIL